MSTGTRHEIYGVVYDVWYDRTVRSWVIQVKDREDNQVGDAQYAATRDLALIYVGLESVGLGIARTHPIHAAR